MRDHPALCKTEGQPKTCPAWRGFLLPVSAVFGSERCLAALKWIKPQVVAVQFDQVEGVEEYPVISAVVAEEVKRGHAVVIAGDSFAIDDA